MNRDVLYVTPNDTVEDCMALMIAKKTRHLLVMDNHKLAGLISIGDVVAQVISDHKFAIKELENTLQEIW